MTQVSIWIVEEAELRETKLTCEPRTLPPGVRKGGYAWFASEVEFVKHVYSAFCEMLRRPDERRLLVLSAHGKAKTGTHLEVARNAYMRLDAHSAFFAIRPQGLVTIVSACWGGYPSVIAALQAGTATQPTLIIAPLVNIHPDHVNAVQADVAAAMLVQNAVDDDALEEIVLAHDTELRERYAQPVLRIVRRDGSMNPPEGEAGLAAPMEETACYRVIALQRLPPPNTEPSGYAILLAPDGTFWRAAVSEISDAATEDAAYALQGSVVVLRGKRLKYAIDAHLGELLDVVRLTTTTVKARSMPDLPYTHSTERTSTKPIEEARPVGGGSLKRCKRCNWASYSFESVMRDRKEIHQVRAVCHRPECPEHAKWPPS